MPAAGSVVAESVVEEDFGEAGFPIGTDQPNIKRGRHFHADLRLPSADDSTHEGLWAPMRTALASNGWTVAKYVDANPPSATLRYQQNGVDAWIIVTMFAKDDIRMELVEVKPFTPTLTLEPPAARPETIGPNDPFPLKGARRTAAWSSPGRAASSQTVIDGSSISPLANSVRNASTTSGSNSVPDPLTIISRTSNGDIALR